MPMDFRKAVTANSLLLADRSAPTAGAPVEEYHPHRSPFVMQFQGEGQQSHAARRDVSADPRVEEQAIRKAMKDKAKEASKYTDAKFHPILGLPTVWLETEELMNTIMFISAGIFLIYFSDAMIQMGRRRARTDAILELLQQRMQPR